MDEEVKEKRTFLSRFWKFQCEVVLFGLMNVPYTFQRLMEKVFMEVPFVRVHLDDFVIFSYTLEKHMDHVSFVLKRIASQGLKVKVNKYTFTMRQVELLGHIICVDNEYVSQWYQHTRYKPLRKSRNQEKNKVDRINLRTTQAVILFTRPNVRRTDLLSMNQEDHER